MFGRIIAFLLLVGLLAVVGTTIYNAGVTAGIAADIGSAIASGDPVPIGVYGPYVGHPWGYGWGWGGGFLGILFGIFFLFLIFGLLRAAFGWGRWGGGHRGWGGHKGYSWDHHRGPREYFDEWHREQHGEAPEAPDKPDKPEADRV